MRVPLPLSLWAVRHTVSGEVLNDAMRPSGAKA